MKWKWELSFTVGWGFVPDNRCSWHLQGVFNLFSRSQCCGSGSGLKSGSRRAKMTPKNNVHLWSGNVLFGGWGFSCNLDLLYEGLGISRLQLLIKKIKFSFNSWSWTPWIRIRSVSRFTWNAGSGSGFKESGSTKKNTATQQCYNVVSQFQ